MTISMWCHLSDSIRRIAISPDVIDFCGLAEGDFPDAAERVITHFEEYCSGRLRLNHTWCNPMFSRGLWNIHCTVLAGQPRTNNSRRGLALKVRKRCELPPSQGMEMDYSSTSGRRAPDVTAKRAASGCPHHPRQERR